jgi:hypothetical protein
MAAGHGFLCAGGGDEANTTWLRGDTTENWPMRASGTTSTVAMAAERAAPGQPSLPAPRPGRGAPCRTAPHREYLHSSASAGARAMERQDSIDNRHIDTVSCPVQPQDSGVPTKLSLACRISPPTLCLPVRAFNRSACQTGRLAPVLASQGVQPLCLPVRCSAPDFAPGAKVPRPQEMGPAGFPRAPPHPDAGADIKGRRDRRASRRDLATGVSGPPGHYGRAGSSAYSDGVRGAAQQHSAATPGARPLAAQRSARPGHAGKRWPAQGTAPTGSPASRT